jgi:hypothetical protein
LACAAVVRSSELQRLLRNTVGPHVPEVILTYILYVIMRGASDIILKWKRCALEHSELQQINGSNGKGALRNKVNTYLKKPEPPKKTSTIGCGSDLCCTELNKLRNILRPPYTISL